MERTASQRTPMRGARWVALAALLLAGLAIVALPLGQRTSRAATVTEPVLIGEHSALGQRRVDALNAAIAGSSQFPMGEHAGLSRADYEAGSALDGSGG